MATWNDLREYIYANYKVADETPGVLSLVFDLENGRSQVVLVSHAEMNLDTEQWIQVESAVAQRSQVSNVWAVLDELSEYVVGGLAVAGDYVTVRHAVPLPDMSVGEFESPLSAVMYTADRLESIITQADHL